jgi:hypothetical protein
LLVKCFRKRAMISASSRALVMSSTHRTKMRRSCSIRTERPPRQLTVPSARDQESSRRVREPVRSYRDRRGPRTPRGPGSRRSTRTGRWPRKQRRTVPTLHPAIDQRISYNRSSTHGRARAYGHARTAIIVSRHPPETESILIELATARQHARVREVNVRVIGVSLNRSCVAAYTFRLCLHELAQLPVEVEQSGVELERSARSQSNALVGQQMKGTKGGTQRSG